LLDKLFQVLPEGSAVDDLVSLAIMVGAIFFCSEKCGIVGLVSSAELAISP